MNTVAETTAHQRSKILTVAAKEWTDIRRDTRFRLLACLTLILMVCALAFGATQRMRDDRWQKTAAQIDHALWLGQGNRHPHAAAHFGQYVFKPTGPLALADPGVEPYLGTAIWLEAHKQNAPLFRPARDGEPGTRLGKLSLAFILQTLMPLFIILLGFSTFSSERERGTLKQLLSSGVQPMELLLGKDLAITAAILALLLPAFLGIALAVALVSEAADTQQGELCLLALGLGYTLYLGGFIALALAISALTRRSGTALILLLAFWLINCFLAPRFITDLVRNTLPLPSAEAFHHRIAEERKQTFGHDENHPAFIAFRDRVLREYGAKRLEALPVNFFGLALRQDDENGYRIYDAHYSALQTKIARQDRLWSLPAMLLPLLGMQPYSMGMAGTDSRHHDHFATAAEGHRRLIQNKVSEKLIYESRYGDDTYTTESAFWGQIPAFDYQVPQASWAFAGQARNLTSLAAWFMLTALLAFFSIRNLRA
jgi:ABC-2 type transport system permease protein